MVKFDQIFHAPNWESTIWLCYGRISLCFLSLISTPEWLFLHNLTQCFVAILSLYDKLKGSALDDVKDVTYLFVTISHLLLFGENSHYDLLVLEPCVCLLYCHSSILFSLLDLCDLLFIAFFHCVL